MEEDRELENIIRKMLMKRALSRTICCQKTVPAGYEITSRKELEQLISNCRVVFINFYSPLCPYCEMFKPIYLRVARKYSDKAVFARSNTAYSPELAWSFNVMATPTTVALVNGKVVVYIPGYIDEITFNEIVLKTLSKAGCQEGNVS